MTRRARFVDPQKHLFSGILQSKKNGHKFCFIILIGSKRRKRGTMASKLCDSRVQKGVADEVIANSAPCATIPGAWLRSSGNERSSAPSDASTVGKSQYSPKKFFLRGTKEAYQDSARLVKVRLATTYDTETDMSSYYVTYSTNVYKATRNSSCFYIRLPGTLWHSLKRSLKPVLHFSEIIRDSNAKKTWNWATAVGQQSFAFYRWVSRPTPNPGTTVRSSRLSGLCLFIW